MAGDIVWRDGRTPQSARFGDIYFSPDDGAAESRHVFLGGIGAPDLWRGRRRTTLGETGFGTGLNFLLTWRAWRDTAPPSARLHYVAVEGYPLRRDDLSRALAAFPDLAAEAAALVAVWPVPHRGHHLLDLDGGRVRLHLLVGPVEEALRGLSARVDGWYLDGFAPSRNPEMWTPAVFAQIARLSALGARLATFTAAGRVRRDLEAAGFTMNKRPGFGHKRECLAGHFKTTDAGYGPQAADPAPWFRRADPVADGPVAILGGGIAGAAMAHALQRAGREAVVLEGAAALAREGSGNPSALMKPRLTPDGHPYGRFHALGWLHALRLYDSLQASVWRDGRGVLAAARDAGEAAEQARLVQALTWPAEDLRLVEAAEAEHLSGCAAPLGGLWFGRAGCLHPQVLCPALAEGVEVRTGVRVGAFARHGDTWVLRDPEGGLVAEVAALVLAAGAALPDLWPEAQWPLGKSRGQITFVAASAAGPHRAVSFGGYLTAPFTAEDSRRIHALGATYDRWRQRPEDWRPLRQEDHARNADLLRTHLPDLAARLDLEALGGRAGLRCTIPDHMPLAGPVHDHAAFLDAFADLHHGRRADRYPPAPYHPGLFVLGALGSRGFQTAPLAAEVVAAEIEGAPRPVETDVAAALHPARFAVRHLKQPPQRQAIERKRRQNQGK